MSFNHAQDDAKMDRTGFHMDRNLLYDTVNGGVVIDDHYSSARALKAPNVSKNDLEMDMDTYI